MTRTLLTLAATVATWGAAGPVSGQFFPPAIRPGAYYNSPFGSYSVGYSQHMSMSYSFVNPFNGVPYSYRFGYSYAGPTPFRGGAGYGTSNYSPYGYGGAAYQPTITPRAGGFNPVAQQQLRAFAQAANQAPAAPVRAVPRPAAAAARKPALVAGRKPVETDPALVVPADADVLSGKTLNALAAAIRGLEDQGARADAPLLPAELLGRLKLAGSPGAEAIAALREGVPRLPEILQRQEFLVCRKELEKHLAAVAEPITQGKAAPVADVDGLAAAVAKCRKYEGIRDLPVPDAAVVTKFLDSLDSVATVAKDPAWEGVVVPKWNTVGATATELIRHTGKYKLTFAPASDDRAEAYRALHRGLAGYYTALAANGV